MSETTIQASRNGPFIVRGACKVVDHEGREFTAPGKLVALCRCGQSSQRPFCDGTHNRCGFLAEEMAS